MSDIFPQLDIPDFYELSKNKWWNPELYAPIVYNPKVRTLSEQLKPGTIEYDDFWDEMDYYCINGFKPKGNMPRITGRHFFYLNFCKIKLLPPGKKMKVYKNPFYRDLDHWLFLELEAAEKYGYGLIIAKPRQVGLSEFGATNCNYNLKFYKDAEIAVATGHSDKYREFKEKLDSSLANTHEAYKLKRETNNENLLEMFYKDIINKQQIEGGMMTRARFKTMYASSGAFEGINNCKMAIFEEAGLFENLTMSYKATAPAFMSGAIQYGLPLVYGTGGEIDSGAKGYDEMWKNHEAYNLKPLFVSATHFYPGEAVDEDGKPVMVFDHKKGVTNRELARHLIMEHRKIASKASKDVYIKHLQTYPLTPSEVFIKTKGGVLDLVKLNHQLKEIREGNSFEPVMRGRLEWEDTPKAIQLLSRAKNLKEKTKIRIANDCKVKFVADEDGPMWKQGTPINPSIDHLTYKPDIGGCDSYDEEAGNERDLSAGAIVAYRCFSGPSRPFNYPVGVLCQRGDASFDDDVFYENAVKFAVYWDMEVLIEYSKTLIIRYFKDVGGERYLKEKPDLENNATSTHKNVFGMKMNKETKAIVTKLLKMEVNENIDKYFIEDVILDMMKYGEENTDISMALGLALAHRMDLFEEITEDIEIGSYSFQDDSINNVVSSYYVDLDGNLKADFYGNQSSNVQHFIPERDLDGGQYGAYLQKKKEEKEKKEMKELSESELAMKRMKSMNIDASILGMILKEQNVIREASAIREEELKAEQEEKDLEIINSRPPIAFKRQLPKESFMKNGQRLKAEKQKRMEEKARKENLGSEIKDVPADRVVRKAGRPKRIETEKVDKRCLTIEEKAMRLVQSRIDRQEEAIKRTIQRKSKKKK